MSSPAIAEIIKVSRNNEILILKYIPTVGSEPGACACEYAHAVSDTVRTSGYYSAIGNVGQ